MKKSEFRRKTFIRITSMILTLLILFAVPPTVVYAEALGAIASIGDGDGDGAAVEADGDAADAYTTLRDVYEVTELREESVKHFRLEDGSYVAMAYDAPVHYAGSDGSWVDIDNRLSDVGSEYSTSNARIKFSKKITGNGTLFTLHENNAKITLSLIDAVKKTEGRVTSDHSTDEMEETTLGKLANLENLTSSILYEDILEGVDLEYVVRSLNVKENIIVKERLDSYTFTFELALNNLTAALTDTGDVRIGDASGETAYVIPAPIVFDNGGAYAPRDAAGYTLTGGENGKYTLTVSVSPDWMNADERAYPITVDPTLAQSSVSVIDTIIDSDSPDASYPNVASMTVDSSCYLYWKSTYFPTIPKTAYITEAHLNYQIAATGFGTASVKAQMVTSDWDASLTYNSYLAGAGQKSRYLDIKPPSLIGGTSLDVTYAARLWHSGNDNYGIALSFDASENVFFSKKCTAYTNESDSKPSYTVKYTDMKGVEPYWSYSSHSAGAAGSGSVNLATGQLTLVIPTLSTTDSLMPYAPTLIYHSGITNEAYVAGNAATANMNMYMPYGFQLNICETVVEKQYDSTTYYIYSDADGTEHEFNESDAEENVFIDNSGMQKVLTVQPDGSVHITDDSKQTRVFANQTANPVYTTDAWYLSKIIDKSGNAVAFTYDSDLRPTKVSLIPKNSSQIDFLDLYYYPGGLLRMVYNSTSKDAVVFRYSATRNGSITTTDQAYLSQIDYAHGNSSVTLDNWQSFANNATAVTNITVDNTATYRYMTNGCISRITDVVAQQSIQYSWFAANSPKVYSVTNYAGSTKGQTVKYSYTLGSSNVTSSGSDDVIDTSDDVITRYSFDEYGRSKSVYSYGKSDNIIYGATVGKYETQENIKNNLKEQTILGGSSVNYLLNGDFEGMGFSSYTEHWILSGSVTTQPNNTLSNMGTRVVSLTPAAGTTASISQYVFLKAGTYTLSMPYYTYRGEGVTAQVDVTSTGTSGFTHTEELSLDKAITGSNLRTFATTFTVLDSANGGDTLKITISVTASPTVTVIPTVEIDAVMLENNIGASEYNFVKYGGFDESVTDSTGTAVLISNFWSSNTGIYYSNAAVPFGKALGIYGSFGSTKYATQRVYEISDSELNLYDNQPSAFYSNAGAEYTVAGYAMATNALLSDTGKFRIRIDVIYYQGENNDDVTVSHYFDFSPDCTSWQFTGGTFNTEHIANDEDTNDYSCVRAIDVVCEYSNQSSGYAYFDNISVTRTDDGDLTRYYYYENGLLAQKVGVYYVEWYEYDASRNLTRIANNRGEIVDYTYSNGLLTSEVYYTYTDNPDDQVNYRDYPFGTENPDLLITKTPKTKTTYMYNTYGLCTTTETYQVDAELNKVSGTKSYDYHQYIYQVTAGSKIFGALTWEWDGLDVDIRYYYDSTNGRLLATVNSDEGNGICYLYDDNDKLVGVMPATYVSGSSYNAVTDAESVTYTYDERDLLSTISTDSTTYSFAYDVFANPTAVNIGDSEIVAYTYNNYNGKLNEVNYANGFSVEYVYNAIELLSEVWYTYSDGTREKVYEYEYTADGQIYRFVDNVSNKSTVYRYDVSNRLIGSVQYDNDTLYHEQGASVYYNDKGYISGAYYSLGGCVGNGISTLRLNNGYTYNDDGSLQKFTASTPASDSTVSFVYDDYKRLTTISYLNTDDDSATPSFTNNVSYTYKTYSTRTSSWIDTYTSTVNGTATTYTYSYDQNGNITQITVNGAQINYEYDDLGQLVKETNYVLDREFTYTYDDAGNLIETTSQQISVIPGGGDLWQLYAVTPPALPTNPITTYTYGYTDSEWGDLLTSYRGQSITYDEIGNPLSYYNGTRYTFTWTGRQLTGAVKGSNTYSFTYNDDGIRTSKTVNGVTTTYYLNGSQILGEETNGNVTVYVYDESGLPIGMQYHASTYAEDVWDIYWYEKDLQGNVVAVYAQDGTKVVSYKYDAWGACTTSTYVSGTAASNNPFKYRGYYYDKDLGLYYLNTRYYDSTVKRFINADDIDVISATPTALTDKNLYAYCDNNPVMRRDDGGQFWETAFDVISLGASIVEVCVNPADPWAWAGLVGDAVDLIPFVSGVGEVTDIIRVATKVDEVVDAVDDIHDTAKAIDRISESLDTSAALSKATRKQGWKVGDDVTNLTKAGNEPSWTTIRQRYWKNQAAQNASAFSGENLERMKKGLAPIIDNAPMELHHPFGREGANFYIFEPLTKAEHHLIHYGW